MLATTRSGAVAAMVSPWDRQHHASAAGVDPRSPVGSSCGAAPEGALLHPDAQRADRGEAVAQRSFETGPCLVADQG